MYTKKNSGKFQFTLNQYNTSGGATTSDVGVGEGSPRSGVLPWMAKDEFIVFGGYVEARLLGALTVQSEFWKSSHDADRDPAAVVSLVNNTHLLSAQVSRFLLDPAGAIDEANVDTDGDYDVKTWYIRLGYSQEIDLGEIAPYAQWDFYENMETIKKKRYGGDNEAGASEDGAFSKSTLGIIYRPIPLVALKLDQSYHFYKLDGKDVNYSVETRK